MAKLVKLCLTSDTENYEAEPTFTLDFEHFNVLNVDIG